MELLRNIYDASVTAVLGVMAYYDRKERRIPNVLSVQLLLMKIARLFLLCFLSDPAFFEEVTDSLFGILFFGVIGWVMYLFLNKTTGAGDFKLLIVSGFALGFSRAVSVSAICLLITLILFAIRRSKKEKTKKTAFAPIVFLAFACQCLFEIAL